MPLRSSLKKEGEGVKKLGEDDGPRLRQSGDGVLGHWRWRQRQQRERKGAQTSVEAAAAAAEPGCALSASPRVGSAQERPSETERLFGHREVPEHAQHGPDLRRGHGAPTRAEEIQDVLAVVVSRSSTVRRRLPLRLSCCLLNMGVVCTVETLRARVLLFLTNFFPLPILFLKTFCLTWLHFVIRIAFNHTFSPHTKTPFTT